MIITIYEKTKVPKKKNVKIPTSSGAQIIVLTLFGGDDYKTTNITKVEGMKTNKYQLAATPML